ncbi:hypothetical protein HGM15179_021920, partial [Zosterops borbonicus]
ELLELLFAHPEIFVGENVLEESENLSNPEQVSSPVPQVTQVCLSPEYVEHLKDEGRVCAIIARLQRYLQGKGSPEELCRVYLRRVLHTYYKFDYGAARKRGGASAQVSHEKEKNQEKKEEDGQVKVEQVEQVKVEQVKEEEEEEKGKKEEEEKKKEKEEEEEDEDSEALMERLCR